MTTPVTAYHATTARAAQLIWDGGEGLDPDWSERFEHVFLFGALHQAVDFIMRYRDYNFPGEAVILEFDVTGLALEPDPQKPPLTGAWRCADVVALDRLRAEYDAHGLRTWARSGYSG